MKKILTICLIATLLTGCQANKRYQLIDTQGYNYAIIKLPNNEIIEGDIQYWRDYEGEQLEIRINDIVYLVSSFNCTLIYK